MNSTRHSFKYWQWRVIIGTMIGYCIYYFVRKNFSFAIPALTAEYGITKSSFGIIMTLIGIIYGISKLLNGVLADRLNARIHMTTGLLVCVILNFIFGFGAQISTILTGSTVGEAFVNTMIVLFAVLLIVNNLFQGCGFPPCNRLMTHWVPPTELATKMSVWNVAHSLGGSLVAIICGAIIAKLGTDMTLHTDVVQQIAANLNTEITDPRVLQAARHYGAWSWCFWIPAFIGLFGVFFIWFVIRDTPKSVGLQELPNTKTTLDEDDSSHAFKAYVRKMVFRNPIIWILAVSDLFVYIIRYIIFDWGPTFLQEEHHMDPLDAGICISVFEVCGIFGMLLSGWISDHLFHSKSQQVCAVFMAFTALFAGVFAFMPNTTNPLILIIVIGFIGFFLYGPQALLGVVAANHATKKAASTALGVIGFTSYLSSIVSGAVVGFLVDPEKGNLPWSSIFYGMFAVAIIGTIIMASIWRLKGDGYIHD